MRETAISLVHRRLAAVSETRACALLPLHAQSGSKVVSRVKRLKLSRCIAAVAAYPSWPSRSTKCEGVATIGVPPGCKRACYVLLDLLIKQPKRTLFKTPSSNIGCRHFWDMKRAVGSESSPNVDAALLDTSRVKLTPSDDAALVFNTWSERVPT
ncbi:unnamed protein product [Ixodes pacificus]